MFKGAPRGRPFLFPLQHDLLIDGPPCDLVVAACGQACYCGPMSFDLPGGTVHLLPGDLEVAIGADDKLVGLWHSLTPLGRNEFICWVEDAKQAATRARRISRTAEELREGKRRPCCWAGCIHRPDKEVGKWQQALLIGDGP